MSDSFHVEGAQTVFESRVFNVEVRRVSHNHEEFERSVAVHPGAVAILVINDRGEVGFIRQYRATFEREVLEIPAGTLDVPGEEPLAAARRELREEMGLTAEHWTFLGRFMNSPGWSSQVMWLYEARDLHDTPREPAGAEEGSATLHWYAKDELRTVLRAEDAIDSTTAIALHRLFGTFLDDV
ncbi:MAG TPA: NUDIX hydrolase [Acidimicrobiales bacterium]